MSQTTKRRRGRPRNPDNARRKPVTLKLDTRLHARMKARAALRGCTLRDAIERAMAEYLERH
jgi:macrodomain Ter protein organizer (MatP/YcbG family)